MTGHGARSVFSSWCNEQGFNADAIERQLAHAPRDAVRAAYNRSDYLPERRRMMVAWANYLDERNAVRKSSRCAPAVRMPSRRRQRTSEGPAAVEFPWCALGNTMRLHELSHDLNEQYS